MHCNDNVNVDINVNDNVNVDVNCCFEQKFNAIFCEPELGLNYLTNQQLPAGLTTQTQSQLLQATPHFRAGTQLQIRRAGIQL
jgi:hypothetical protein